MDEAISKTCTRCSEVLPLAAFGRQAQSRDGLNSRCKRCLAENMRNRRADDREGSRAKQRAWYAANREHVARYNKSRKDAGVGNYLESGAERQRRRRARKAAAFIGPVDPAMLRSLYPDCYLCGRKLSGPVHMDHVVPLSRGGAHSMANLLPTHPECNLRKHDKHLSELSWYVGPVLLGVASRMLT